MNKKYADHQIAFRASMEIQKTAAAADMTVAAFAEMHGIALQNLVVLHRAGIDVLYVLTGERKAAAEMAVSEAAKDPGDP